MRSRHLRLVKEESMTRVARWSIALVLLGSALLFVSGCHHRTAAGGGKAAFTVLVPCGQVGPFNDIEKLWNKQNPTLPIKWSMGNMVTLTEDVLAHRKTADVFLSMGDLEVDRLQKAGLVMDRTGRDMRTMRSPSPSRSRTPAAWRRSRTWRSRR